MRKVILNEYVNKTHVYQKIVVVNNKDFTNLLNETVTARELFNKYEAPVKEIVYENISIENGYSCFGFDPEEVFRELDFTKKCDLLKVELPETVNNDIKKEISNWCEILPELITANEFEATFIKKDNSLRTIKCLFESTRYIDKGVLTVFDLEKGDYRSISLTTLLKVQVKNKVFEFKLLDSLNQAV